MGIRGFRPTGAYVDEAAQFADQRANVTTPGTPSNAGEQAMEQSKGWKNLPLKEQGLARAIVSGFAAELALDRRLRGIQ